MNERTNVVHSHHNRAISEPKPTPPVLPRSLVQDGRLEDVKGDGIGLAECRTPGIDHGRAHQMGASFYFRERERGGGSSRHLAAIEAYHDLMALL